MADPTVRELSPLHCIQAELILLNVKFGKQNHSDVDWFPLLMEEVGEIAHAICETNPVGKRKYHKDACIENLEIELIQTAAVCVAWIEAIRRRE